MTQARRLAAAAEWTETVYRLEAQLAQKQAVVTTADERRRKFAFRASQGDEAAAAELEQIVVDEREAANAIQNLNLAIAEARQGREAALEEERDAEVEQSHQHLSALGDELIEIDVRIVAAVRALHDLLEQRASTIEQIGAVGLLSHIELTRLTDRQSVEVAIASGLGRHYPATTQRAPKNGLENMVTRDCRLMGKSNPLAPAPLTATERAMRQMLNSRGLRAD